jgi:methanogenic corrinoid protein MtbC1
MNSLEPLTEAILTGRRHEAAPVTQEAIGSKVAPDQFLEALISGMDEVGG